jgi:hypothetical protein
MAHFADGTQDRCRKFINCFVNMATLPPNYGELTRHCGNSITGLPSTHDSARRAKQGDFHEAAFDWNDVVNKQQ